MTGGRVSAAPARTPCVSCPYRRDVPSGVWVADEYAKLPRYDLPTPEQPITAFFCHQRTGRLCSGWVGCHDMEHSLGLRLALSFGHIGTAAYAAALEYVSPVELWPTGAEAAAHGLREVDAPGDEAWRVMRKVAARHRRGASE
jgi:hypothetical protein